MYLKKIEKYQRYNKKPNTISKGYLYIKEFVFENKIKKISVYLPYNYSFKNSNKRFPVMYMFDGQNLVDKYQTAFGEWNCDEEISKLIKNKEIEGLILVGITSPKEEKERMEELCPNYNEIKKKYKNLCLNPKLDKLMEFVIEQVKPDIDKNFYTKQNKENTSIGGSSMGGLAAFYAGFKYREIFSFSLIFSPAFMLFKKDYLQKKLKNINTTGVGKMCFYVGGTGFEKQFIKNTELVYNKIIKTAPNGSVKYIFDEKGIHHESSWQKHFSSAVKMFLKTNQVHKN